MLGLIPLSLLVLSVVAQAINGRGRLPPGRRANGTAEEDLEVIQAATPPRISLNSPACRQTIIQHVFANSYGSPYVGLYSPPVSCSFTTTVFDLSVTSQGRQYDRLALLYLGDVEVWRTSTAMPTQSGIQWSFQKDVSVFHSMLVEEQTIIFDLANVIDGDLYTAAYNVTIEALYFDDNYEAGFNPAEKIYPISTLASSENTTSVFSLPDDSGSVNVTLPRNIESAVVSITASGNSAEEFWFTNVPSEYTNTFSGNDGWLYGYSPFREIQLLIDGQLAGVSWPFPILFTGGVDPGAWRPIVGIDTYDLPSFEIDVTPWLSLLCDGGQHTLKLQVVAYDTYADDHIGTVGENWWVSGALFLWLDSTINQTNAGEVRAYIPAPTFNLHPLIGSKISSNGTVTNTSLYFSLDAERSLSISSTIRTANGSKVVTWEQDLSFSNVQNMTDRAYNQSLSMVTSGSYSGSAWGIKSHYRYPMNLFSAYDVAATGAVTSPGSVFCMVDRSKLTDGITLLPFMSGMVLGTEKLATRQNVTSRYYWNETIVEGIEDKDTCDGETWYSFLGAPGSASGVSEYSRYLREIDDTTVDDEESWSTITVPDTVALPVLEGEPPV
ncbi:peptide N-acetyl-beta-D-glucosaminyl asparaginase amidase A-domain-containing protein [Xylariales sp. AK1849]|nr:peptide N-acetyl-beta-D-glucosaminyl asparaginase amidase A-domain-containing protein [Xylariales sp. AK1849]